MLRPSLQRKVFLALTALLAVLLLIFAGLSRLGLQRSLGDYVAEIELSRMDWFVQRLAQGYADKGSWQYLRDDTQAWHRAQSLDGMRRGPPRLPPNGFPDNPDGPPAQRPFGGPREPFGPGPGGPGGGPPGPQLDVLPGRYFPPPPLDAEGDPRRRADMLYARLALLDADGRSVVAGTPLDLSRAPRRPIEVDGRTVGYLAVAPLASDQTEAGRAFITQQSTFVIATGLAGLVLALAISWWLARRWLAPVRALVDGAGAVAGGALDTRVPVHGDDEFALLARSFNAMTERLAQAETSRQHWLADVAHELRTPLAAMRAEIEALQDGVRTFDAQTAERLHRQTLRLGRLVDDLRLSMQGADAPPLNLAPVRPVELLLEAAGLVRERYAQAGLVVDTAGLQPLAGPDGPERDGDAARLHQVFANLLENSLRYTHAGGRLVLAARIVPPAEGDPAATLVLQFDDTEPAPRPEDLPRLFERFYRGESSRSRAYGGSGLGLAICRALVEAHGGRMTAALSPLGGLQVSVQLPL